MTFPTNSSPYGGGQNFQASPMNMGSRQRRGFRPLEALFGQPERNYQQSLLGPEQQENYGNLQQAGSGAFSSAADYYRGNLSNDPQDMEAFAAPELRRFREQTVPDLAEQFSGYGGIGSSGFRNAALGAGADLSERLGAIRAGIRQDSARNLSNIGQMSLNNFNENVHRPQTYGLLGEFASGAGKALGSSAGQFLANKFGGSNAPDN